MSSDATADLIRSLARPEAFPFPVAEVEIHQTHVSAVFLGGKTAYKIKKPVNLGFLDFSTLERRRRFCEEEVRLNRRLAPLVYQDVVPIADTSSGMRFEGSGPVTEWAVKMVRMSPEMDLEHRLKRNEIDRPVLRSLANRLAQFHRTAPTSDLIAMQARWKVVAENALANLLAAREHVGQSISAAVLDRLTSHNLQSLRKFRPLIENRAANAVPRDTHGDLRLDHVYWFPDRSPPDDWVILDCIEFNDRFRHADPVSDIAFLAMDLAYHGRWDLARTFADEYFEAANDPEGRKLLPFYASYRAAVRAKVEAILQDEAEVPDDERDAAALHGKAHWLAALCWLEPATPPRVVLVGGLPGTGKTTLARALAERLEAQVLRSDVVRKELAGAEYEPRPDAFGEGLYSDAWTDRTYDELERRAAAILWNGGQVIVDASFRQHSRRLQFMNLALRWGAPFEFLHCTAPPSVAKERLRQRRGDASDADESVYEIAARRWEPFTEAIQRFVREVATEQSIAGAALQAAAALTCVWETKER